MISGAKCYDLIFRDDRGRLVQFSFLMFFVELTLIRWSGSTVYYLFFFTNFVLLASFLGIAIGFIRSKSSLHLFPYAPILLAIIIFLCYRYSYNYQPQLDMKTGNLNYYSQYFTENIYPIWLTLPLIFTAVAAIMACLADGVARVFQKFETLQAYRLEIIGSLAGIIIFSSLSFFHAKPIWWGIVIIIAFLPSLIRPRNSKLPLFIIQIAALLFMLFVFAKESMIPNHFWSSYYKIEVQPYATNQYVVNVNGLAQQVIESVAARQKIKPFYFLPYQHRTQKNLDKTLIIGAGTGGDVAIALAQGAKKIDAVEIDSMIYQLGKRFNPDKPYHDSRVSVYINDGRSFLQQSVEKYDLIIFALTDSLMLIPGQSSLRLENYLYTIESISRVYQLLKPDGVFTIYNYYHAPWLVDRLAKTLNQVFKNPPCLDTSGANDYWATVLTVSPESTALQCKTKWQGESQNNLVPSSDNHPFLYLKENNLSLPYLIALGFILIFSLTAVRLTSGSFNSIKNYPDLFLMGCAFLLLETKSIIHFSLLFGTTWFVNALVFMGILFAIYLAIEVTKKGRTGNVSILYVMLLICLGVNWFIPNNFFLSLPFLVRFIVAITTAFLPIFIANLIFANRFRNAINSTEALGANFLGAMMGGILEYASIMLGYQHLLILIMVLYSVAILLMRSKVNNDEVLQLA